MTLSPIWTNCWPQTRPACGTTIRKHCRRNRDRRDFDHRLRIDPSAAARRATSECSENASATTCSKFEQSARSMDRDATGRSKKDRKSTRLNSSHPSISYAVFCLKKKKKKKNTNKKQFTKHNKCNKLII